MAWFGNRLTQSIAWAGLIKVSSKWFDYSSYGMIMGIFSISYLVGDALARQSMGMLIEHGFDWQVLFYFAAAVAGRMFRRQSVFSARVARRKPDTMRQSRTRSICSPRRARAAERRRIALAAAAQPSVSARLPAFARLHHNSRDLQYLDSGLSAGLSGLHHGQCGGHERGVSPESAPCRSVTSGWLSDRLGVNGRALLLFVGLPPRRRRSGAHVHALRAPRLRCSRCW